MFCRCCTLTVRGNQEHAVQFGAVRVEQLQDLCAALKKGKHPFVGSAAEPVKIHDREPELVESHIPPAGEAVKDNQSCGEIIGVDPAGFLEELIHRLNVGDPDRREVRGEIILEVGNDFGQRPHFSTPSSFPA